MQTPESSHNSGQPVPLTRTRKVARVVAVLLVLAALIVTPPLINVSRLQRRIAASMSASLGRPVRMDRISMHLLPAPGFTLTGLVVNEDPAFGSEPTIRANAVEVTLRPSSLWRRQVELSKITFVEPSLNLVRNAQGRWNLEDLLVHASRVDTAPTEQRKAGPEPRFPYIEATGGRVNIKMGMEKLPFALTEADFALWLPSPQQWRIRLEGRPARTDTSISDPGILRLEGSLERAATMADVPVDLRATWQEAPLGEVSKLLSGNEADWRGTLLVDASMTGKLGAAALNTTVSVHDLHRSDFVPEKMLNVQAGCTGTLDTATAVVANPQCTIPAPCGLGVSAISDRLDLAHPAETSVRIGTPGVPQTWLLDWARLFSQSVPDAEGCGQSVQGSLVFVPGGSGQPDTWNGQVQGQIANPLHADGDTTAALNGLTISGAGQGFVLAPLNLMPPKAPPLLVSGTLDRQGYVLTLAGTATEEQMHKLELILPPLGEGLDKVLPDIFTDATKPTRINLTCSRPWGQPEACQPAAPPPVVETKPTRRHSGR